MSKKELRLVITMLQDFIDYHLSPAGCNDTDTAWLAPFSSEELAAMNRNACIQNDSPEEWDGTARPLQDFMYVQLMQARLQRLADTNG